MVGFGMSVLNLNYDSKFDILYARVSEYEPSYGDEEDGIVTYFSIETDAITGMAIFNAKKKILNGNLDVDMLPIPIDLNAIAVQNLLLYPERGYKDTLILA